MSEQKYASIFDILGPEMIGPSSSHTAGAVRIGLAARSILNDKLLSVRIFFYNSFADTGAGHGTDKAILAGLMGYEKSDSRIKEAEKIAKDKGIKFSITRKGGANNYKPNTAVIKMKSPLWNIEVVGVSIGGGLIVIEQIDGFEVNINCEYETLIVTHRDKVGILAEILKEISDRNLNIVSINSVRHNKVEDIKTVICFDNHIDAKIRDKLKKMNDILRVRIIHKIEERL